MTNDEIPTVAELPAGLLPVIELDEIDEKRARSIRNTLDMELGRIADPTEAEQEAALNHARAWAVFVYPREGDDVNAACDESSKWERKLQKAKRDARRRVVTVHIDYRGRKTYIR
jgi:hypothetical protein